MEEKDRNQRSLRSCCNFWFEIIEGVISLRIFFFTSLLKKLYKFITITKFQKQYLSSCPINLMYYIKERMNRVCRLDDRLKQERSVIVRLSLSIHSISSNLKFEVSLSQIGKQSSEISALSYSKIEPNINLLVLPFYSIESRSNKINHKVRRFDNWYDNYWNVTYRMLNRVIHTNVNLYERPNSAFFFFFPY